MNLIRKITPEFIRKIITSFFYGWSGVYNTWDEVKNKCSGYDSSIILIKVRDSALKVKNGSALYERDSVIFDTPEYTYPLIISILRAAHVSGGSLNILDFGGSLGSTYYQNKRFLESIKMLNWCIVEQPNYVEEGLKYFEDTRLHFYKSVRECYENYKFDIVLLSSVLQYLEFPYQHLYEIIRYKPQYIIIDRTPFINKPDRITLQKVNPKIYKASYPCWFFNKKKFKEYMAENYEMVFEFDALDKANIKSEFKGFLYALKIKE